MADDLVGAAQRYASPSGALLRLPGPQSASGAWSDGLEGYARTLLAAAFRAAGSADAAPLERYAEGLAAGVDPDHAERWPRFDERRQAIPEAASVAIALSETRHLLWDRLPDRTKTQTVEWMSGVLGRTDFRSNWLWFQNVLEAFLDSVGAQSEPADLVRNAEFADGLYAGDGWYSDGRGRDGERQSFDWYGGWAWHVYPLLEARLRGEELGAAHRARLRSFLSQARDLVGPRGEPTLIGRSLAYRFAVVAPFWAGAIAGVSPLGTGETRELASRVVGHFLDAGSVDADGLLPIGWHRPFPLIRQLYTGGSSTYWASKAFLGLLLDPAHPEWTAEARVPERAVAEAQHAPGWIVVSTPDDGIVRVLNHGSDRMYEPRLAPRADDPFYRRVGFSNVTSPQLGAEAVSNPRESHTALLDADGRASHRDGIERVHLTDTVAVSRSRVHWLDAGGGRLDSVGWAGLRLGPVLTVASVVNGPIELRLAWWLPAAEATGRAATTAEADADAAWPHEDGPWRVSFGGWPLADASAVTAAGRTARATSARASSLVIGVDRADAAATISRTGADPFGETSVTPYAASTEPLGAGELASAVVALTGSPLVHEELVPAVEVVGDEVVVRWGDGRVDTVPTGGEVRA